MASWSKTQSGVWQRIGSIICPVVCLCALSSCADTRAALDVSLNGVPRVDPLVFHGNCVAGWMFSFILRVRETEGVDVRLSEISYQVMDTTTSEVLGTETLTSSRLIERFGENVHMGADQTRDFTLDVRVDGPPNGAVTITGDVRGIDSEGDVRQTYRLSAASVDSSAAPGGGGACRARD